MSSLEAPGSGSRYVDASASIASAQPDRAEIPKQKVTKGEKTAEASVKLLQQNAAQATEVAADALSVEEMRELVGQLREAMPETANSLKFSIDEILNRPVVSVIDQKSGKLIRQLPSNEVIRAAHNIQIMRGILFDNKS